METTVIFKTDKKLKEAAQKTAKEMGIPFSAVLNKYMRDFVIHKEITFRTAFEEMEDRIWGEHADKAHKEGTYLETEESRKLLERLRKKHARG